MQYHITCCAARGHHCGAAEPSLYTSLLPLASQLGVAEVVGFRIGGDVCVGSPSGRAQRLSAGHVRETPHFMHLGCTQYLRLFEDALATLLAARQMSRIIQYARGPKDKSLAARTKRCTCHWICDHCRRTGRCKACTRRYADLSEPQSAVLGAACRPNDVS